MKFDITIFFENVEKIQDSLKSDRVLYIKANIHFFIILFRTKFVEFIKTQILRSVTFFIFENLGIYEIMWKNHVETERPQMTIRRMRTAYWIHKATNTDSEYVLLIAFSTVTIVTQTHPDVTLYVYCLPCSL